MYNHLVWPRFPKRNYLWLYSHTQKPCCICFTYRLTTLSVVYHRDWFSHTSITKFIWLCYIVSVILHISARLSFITLNNWEVAISWKDTCKIKRILNYGYAVIGLTFNIWTVVDFMCIKFVSYVLIILSASIKRFYILYSLSLMNECW